MNQCAGMSVSILLYDTATDMSRNQRKSARGRNVANLTSPLLSPQGGYKDLT
jgi:hypothetical protein